MKTLLTTILLASTALLMNSLAAEKPPIIEFDQWHNTYYPKTYPHAVKQRENNGDIHSITIHSTHTRTGGRSIAAEKQILNDSVHKSGLYQTEVDEDGNPIVAKDGETPRKSLGGVAYHYLIGDSGTIYKGRPDTDSPGTFTYYYSDEMLSRATKDLRGVVTLANEDQRSLEAALNAPFQEWIREIGSEAYQEWEDEQRQFARNAGASDVEAELKKRIFKQKVRLEGPGNTTGHITVAFIGNFDVDPDPEALKSAKKLVTYLLDQHGLTSANIRTHREVANTACPGDFLYRWAHDEENGLLEGLTD